MRGMMGKKKVDPRKVSKLPLSTLRRLIETKEKKPEPWVKERFRVCVKLQDGTSGQFATPRQAGLFVREAWSRGGKRFEKPDWGRPDVLLATGRDPWPDQPGAWGRGMGCAIGDEFVQVYWGDPEKCSAIPYQSVKGELLDHSLTEIEASVFSYGFIGR